MKLNWRFLILSTFLLFNTTTALAISEDDGPAAPKDPNTPLGDDRNADPNKQVGADGIPYYPRVYNDTRDVMRWATYIASAEQDPPNAIILHIQDDSPELNRSKVVDVQVEVGYFDDVKNFILKDMRVVTNISIEKGFNRIVVYIHNEKADPARIRLLAVRPKTAITPFSVTGD